MLMKKNMRHNWRRKHPGYWEKRSRRTRTSGWKKRKRKYKTRRYNRAGW